MERGSPGSKGSINPEFNGFYTKVVNNTGDEARYNVSHYSSCCSILCYHYEQCIGLKVSAPFSNWIIRRDGSLVWL